MNKHAAKESNFLLSFYSILLLAYPRQFRREYGPQMVLLLHDCQRDARDGPARLRLWLRAFVDLVRTVPGEHLQNMREENTMTNHRNDLAAIGGCVLLIIGAILLLNYGRSHQVSSILFFGHVLDAVAFTGIVGNLIVFLLAKLTSLQSLRIALWTFLIVTVVPALALAAIGGRLDPTFSFSKVVIGYTVSFFFWYGLHWLWANRMDQRSSAAN
jgi:hypothetical protein